jgi:3-hydroxyacyl-CoA dehydrogenase / enoyl-CoA hydratase / 3-hydroxybutyryl-CoA epimerase
MYWKLIPQENNIFDLLIDIEDSPVNTLGAAVLTELDTILDELAFKPDVKLLRVVSHKKGCFIAGADINEIKVMQNPVLAREKAGQGQRIFNKLESLPYPTLAVINGVCLGGGLELALACTYRVALLDSRTKMGLPEVQLGIIPGFGGTQRLPRLVGLQTALPWILGGTRVDAKKAMKTGLIDLYLEPQQYEQQLNEFSLKIAHGQKVRKTKKKPLLQGLLEDNSIGRSVIFKKAREGVMKMTKGHYPAPFSAIKVLEKTANLRLKAGLSIELDEFAKLPGTPECQSLIQLFFNSEALKKESFGWERVKDAQINSAAVMGAGIMGGGIAWLYSSKGVPVYMKDIAMGAIEGGMKAAASIYSSRVKKRRMKPDDMTQKMELISGGLNFNSFDKRDIVIEAVIEDITIKKAVLKETESKLSPNALLLSNTSSLSIEKMGEDLDRPENFAGFHFFNPVHRMPLVEIIPGPKTSEQTLSRTLKMCRDLGKTAVVVGDCPGFLVNRILLPYINEAAWILSGGAGIGRVDKILTDYGMPMGPFLLADEVGIDVGYKVAAILEEGYGERMKVCPALKNLKEKHKLLGKKGGKGFYIHKGREKPVVNTEIKSLLGLSLSGYGSMSDQRILDRCILQLVNEASKCLEEGIIERPDYLDMAMVLGTGFPPFRTGPIAYADSIGLDRVCQTLEDLASEVGERFKPSQLIQTLASENKKFYGMINSDK